MNVKKVKDCHIMQEVCYSSSMELREENVAFETALEYNASEGSGFWISFSECESLPQLSEILGFVVTKLGML